MAISISFLNLPQERVEDDGGATEGVDEDETTEEAAEQMDMMGTDWEENDDMDMFRLSQRFTSDDAETEIQKALELLNEYDSQPLNDSPDVEDTTAMVRDRVMKAWNHYFKKINVDPDSIWLGLCHESDQAKNYCRLFLETYTKNSLRKFLVLGPKEYEIRRALNSAASVTHCWRSLIAQADSTILSDKRQQDPKNKPLWRLKFVDHEKERGRGPIFEISKWIYEQLAVKLNLIVGATIEKKEATPRDIIVALDTLWTRADAIRCNPDTRVSFHAKFLIESLGGFRTAAFMDLPYRQIQLAVVRDPENPTKTKIVATIAVKIVKKRKHSRRGPKDDEISFSITTVPFPHICLCSLIIDRAIKEDAFEPSFDSVEALLHRPILENTDYLPLKWKEKKLDHQIFPVSYSRYNEIWHRICLVAGFREAPRLYTLRVGAGARLDGVLSDTLRNYIISNTSQVFLQNYQTKRVREDLTKLAFGSMAGRNDALFQSLRSMSLQRDINAPIDPSAEELRTFYQRRDVTRLGRLAKVARLLGNIKAARIFEGRAYTTIRRLCIIQVQENRAQYFDRVRDLRVLGIPTIDDAHAKPIPQMYDDASGPALAKITNIRQWQCGIGPAVHVARFLQNFTLQADNTGEAEESSERFMTLVLQYLRRRPNDDIDDGELPEQMLQQEEEQVKKEEDKVDEGDGKVSASSTAKKQNRPQCFFCRSFHCHRQALTKHYRAIHIPNGTFVEPFQCPECLRQGIQDPWISASPSAWSNHVETFHGKINAPNLPTYQYSVELQESRCLICNKWFSGQGLTRHVNFTHVGKENMFQQPFPCPECRRQGQQDTWINGASEWYDHVSFTHNEIKAPCVANAITSLSEYEPQTTRGKKRTREEMEAEVSLALASGSVASGSVASVASVAASVSQWDTEPIPIDPQLL